MQYTLSIIKPDGVRRKIENQIFEIIRKNNIEIIGSKEWKFTKESAEAFYAIHKERPFFDALVAYMTSGLTRVQILKGDGVVDLYRKIMGATNPAQAEKGTIRGEFGISIDENTVHGSDSAANAVIEINQLYYAKELEEYHIDLSAN